MGRRFSQHEEIANDLTEIYDFIAFERFAPEAGERVVSEINNTIRRIRKNPERYSRYFPKTFQHESLYRAVVHPFANYLIFFELTEDEIKILYVHHGARDFETRHLEARRS